MVKQWSMDETQSWFYARSASLDRTNNMTTPVISDQESELVLFIFGDLPATSMTSLFRFT